LITKLVLAKGLPSSFAVSTKATPPAYARNWQTAGTEDRQSAFGWALAHSSRAGENSRKLPESFAFRRCKGDMDMIKKVVGDVTEGVSSITEQVTPIAEKVLETGKATAEETKSLAQALIEEGGAGETVNKEVSDIAEKVLEGGQATVEETKRLAASVLGQ
jgi:polyhydroxyalkanoate synthesis regulator phasin